MSKPEEIVRLIRKIYRQPEGSVTLHAPVFGGNEKDYLMDCVDSTFVSSVGKYVDRFEQMIEEYTGAVKAVACVNGTNALHLALVLAGVEPEDEIITQPLTFVATVNAIAYCRAYPVFTDVDRDTLGLSPVKMAEWLEENAEIKDGITYNRNTRRRIRACVPMHTFGHPVHLKSLVELCDKYHIALIEDAAESIGSLYENRHTGTFGTIGILSFNGNKTITTGGGGMLLFRNEELGIRAKHLTTQAKVPHRWEFFHDDIGYNYRMPNINAALGCAQMERIDSIIASKRQIADTYRQFFESTDIRFVVEPENCVSNYWLNAIILKDKEERDEFLEYSNNAGIMTRPIWRLMNELPMYKFYQCGDLSNARWLEERVVNIPSGAVL